MKNIYIIGVPRTGKTTLSTLIKENYPELNLISFEAIRNGFIKSQPELKMENRNSLSRKEILPEFLFEFVFWNNQISGYGNLIEGDFADIEKVIKNSTENDFIICLGFNKRNLDEIIKGIISYDKEDDYTKKWSENQLRNHFHDICQNDIKNYKYCKQFNINYFDTYKDRNLVFDKILHLISEIM